MNNNPLGSAKYWFDGGISQVIDSGVVDLSTGINSSNLFFVGTTEFWHAGTASGFLQGGNGEPGDCSQNLKMTGLGDVVSGARAYALIIF